MRNGLGEATNEVINLLVNLLEFGENFLRQLADGFGPALLHAETEEAGFNKVCGQFVRCTVVVDAKPPSGNTNHCGPEERQERGYAKDQTKANRKQILPTLWHGGCADAQRFLQSVQQAIGLPNVFAILFVNHVIVITPIAYELQNQR